MDGIRKELDKLQMRLPALLPPRAEKSSRAQRSGVFDALDLLIKQFEQAETELAVWHPEAAFPPQGLPSPPDVPAIASQLESAVDASQKMVNASQKELYGALAKFGKAVEKKFPPYASSVDSVLFSSNTAQDALKETVMDHFMRNGDSELFHLFAEEANIPLREYTYERFRQLNVIREALEREDLDLAIDWAGSNRSALKEIGSSLEYALHRSRFLALARGHAPPGAVDEWRHDHLSNSGGASTGADDTSHASHDPDIDTEMVDAVESISDLRSAPQPQNGTSCSLIDSSSFRSTNMELAMIYGRKHLSAFSDTHLTELQTLFTMLLYLPTCRPAGYPSSGDSPKKRYIPEEGPLDPQDVIPFIPQKYRYFFTAPYMSASALVHVFEEAYCRVNSIPRFPPLKVTADIGANGTLSKILRVRAVMQESRTGWSQADELPIEVPLPAHLHFHSIFCCPVSKEQGSDDNPPMLMACGHAVCRESLINLAKGSSYVQLEPLAPDKFARLSLLPLLCTDPCCSSFFGGLVSHLACRPDRRVKCPYCPSESTVGQAMRVYF